MTATAGTHSGSGRNDIHYEDVGMSFADFGLELMKRLPSKKLNVKDYPRRDLEKLRTTSEETSCAISGLEVARGLLLLGHAAEKKTLKEIVRILNIACGTRVENLQGCHDMIEKLIEMKNKKDSNRLDGLRLFIERRTIIPIDRELQFKLNSLFIEKLIEEDDNRSVIKEMHFYGDPSGAANKNKVDEEIKKATYGKVQKVVRSDLSPDWRCRLALAVASDENFQWMFSSDPTFKKAYFYDSFEKKPCYRTWVESVKVKCDLRQVVVDDIHIIEVYSIKQETMVLIIPTSAKLSFSFLREMNTAKILKLIEKLPKEKSVAEIVMPIISSSSPIGFRSIFDKPSPPLLSFFGVKDEYAIPRIFCPHKAEFSRLVGAKSHSLGSVFPLFEYYYKCKTRMSTRPTPGLKTLSQLKRRDPPAVCVLPTTTDEHDLLVASSVRVEAVSTIDENNNYMHFVGRAVFPRHKRIDQASHPHPPRDPIPFQVPAITPSAEPRIGPSAEPNPSRDALAGGRSPFSCEQPIITPSADVVHQKQMSNARSIMVEKQSLPNDRNMNNSRTDAGVDVPGQSPRQHRGDADSKQNLHNFVNKPPDFLPAGDYPRNDTLDLDEEEALHDSRVITEAKDEAYDPNNEMAADVVVNIPFLYLVVSHIEQEGTGKMSRMINYIGRFTGVDETFDRSTLPPWIAQPNNA